MANKKKTAAQKAKVSDDDVAAIKKKHTNIASIIFIVLVIIILWAAYQGGKSGTQDTRAAWKRLSADEDVCDALVCLKVSDAKSNPNYGMGHIYGSAVNYTGKKLSYIQITFGVYVGESKVGSCLANQNYLANGEVWAFDAYCTSAFDKYKVEDVSYW